MSVISSGVGLFSGIDRNSIITQLLAPKARSKGTFQKRIAQLQGVSAAYLDVSSKISNLKSIAASFRTDRIFESAQASSSNEGALKATATIGAPPGEYRVTVGRLATTQQVLSRGFASTSTGVGLTSLVVEGAQGQVNPATRLAQLNGGTGVQRGSIQVTDSSGATATIDISTASTLTDVIDTINNTTGVRIRARLDDTGSTSNNGNGLLIEDLAGGTSNLTISNIGGSTTATDLGIAGTVARNLRLDVNDATTSAITGAQIRGRRINTINNSTALTTLNDGLGVGINQASGTGPTPDIKFTLRDGSQINVDIGAVDDNNGKQTAGPANTLGEVITRINSSGGGKLVATVGSDGSSLRIEDTTTGSGSTVVENFTQRSASDPTAAQAASDLGIAGTFAGGVIQGTRLIGKINSVQVARLGGGGGLPDNQLSVEYRDGTTATLTLETGQSLSDLIASVSSASGGKLTAALDQSGNRITFTDTTGGTGALKFSGGLAGSLGIDASYNSSTASSQRLQRQYIGLNTPLSQLNYGRGIGQGTFSVVSSDGTRGTVNIGSGSTTVTDLIRAINSAGNISTTVGSTTTTRSIFNATINSTGDGIVINDTAGGNNKLTITDTNGGVARALFIAGTASTDTPTQIIGSYERTITVNPSDGLASIASAINSAGLNVRASTLQDGSANPFRIALSSRSTGVAGSFSIDPVGADLGLTTSTQGRDSLVFYGSDNVNAALAVEGATNTISGAIPGVSLELRQTTTTPATISVSTDVSAISKRVSEFVDAYNALIDSITSRSKYDTETEKRGVLLGDSVTAELRAGLQTLVQRPAQGVSSEFRFLFDVGLKPASGGKLRLDETRLKEAIERDPRGVVDLFAARVQLPNSPTRQIAPGITVSESVAGAVTSKGIMEVINDELDRYVRSTTGVLTRQSRVVDDQIKAQNTRITSIDAQIESRRQLLETQFIQMESNIGRLQSQSSSIGNIRAVSGTR
ncbi:MAG: flagellar filament capping protein FliD [bacterium]